MSNKKEIIDIYEIDESGFFTAFLERGEYLIDGEVVEVGGYQPSPVKIKNTDDVRIINNTNYISGYINKETGAEISNEEYDEAISKLIENASSEYDELTFEDLDDEYKYKKFRKYHEPIRKKVQKISDPVKINLKRLVFDTGNKFIRNMYSNGSSNVDLFEYDRPSALLDIVKNKFDSLGMKFVEGASYNSTNGEKIWSNSSHSCIRYVVAFNNYIMGDSWDVRSKKRGSLDDMKAIYKSDKEEVERIIHDRYNLHFKKAIPDNKSVNDIIKKLECSLSHANKIEPKKKTYQDKRWCVEKTGEAIRMLYNILDSGMEDN